MRASDKLEFHFQRTNGCWVWTGPLNDKGYGRFRADEGKVYAHRVAYEKFVGPIPVGMDILHKCDVPRCVNPAHLFLGTQADNNADRDSKGRHVALRGELNGRARITEQVVRLIRASKKSSLSLSKQIGIDASAIRKIRRRECWGHVNGE